MAIATEVAECRQLLDELLKSVTEDEFHMQEAESHISKFNNLWIKQNSIFAPTRESMDWRLRHTSMQKIMLTELELLKSNLTKAKQASVSKGAAGSSEGGSLALLKNIHKALNDFLDFPIYNKLRRNGTGYRELEAKHKYANDVDLTEKFRTGRRKDHILVIARFKSER
ncbi:hypothetical protein AJ79_05912 [Helicocarpus griseus UAMH5409]|uniref:Uncharacterized protein n=1 Tax=Helicocarpus griseus UAMH5409 TaxID=1447875 RepID=A0A2B7XIW1_9EURO|nr:hypothetical protein AJ79_05912 [Helicocarpus griseus UAMH5409]